MLHGTYLFILARVDTASPHPSDDEASVSDEREETDEDRQPNLVDILLGAEYIP